MRRVAEAPRVAVALPPLEVSALPDRRLAANSRDGKLSRWERADLVRDAIAAFQPIALSWLRDTGLTKPLDGPLALRWTLYVPEWRGDASGWASALKPWEDVLTVRHKQGIGAIRDDGPGVVREYTVRVVKDPALAPMTRLELVPMTKEEA